MSDGSSQLPPAGNIHADTKAAGWSRDQRRCAGHAHLGVCREGQARTSPGELLSFTFSALLAVLFGPRVDVLFVESRRCRWGLIAIRHEVAARHALRLQIPDSQVDVARQMGFMTNRVALRVAFALENLFLQAAWKVSTVTHGFIGTFMRAASRVTASPFCRTAPMPNSCAAAAECHDCSIVGPRRSQGLRLRTALRLLPRPRRLLRPRHCSVLSGHRLLMIGNGPERPASRDGSRSG